LRLSVGRLKKKERVGRNNKSHLTLKKERMSKTLTRSGVYIKKKVARLGLSREEKKQRRRGKVGVGIQKGSFHLFSVEGTKTSREDKREDIKREVLILTEGGDFGSENTKCG